MKNIAIWRIMTYFSQENISLVSFSLQQLTIIRNKIVPLHCVRKQAALVAKCSNKFGISLVCTAFVLRKRGELLDGKLSFSMTQENERWNSKNGGFFYRGTSKKRFSAVLIVRFS